MDARTVMSFDDLAKRMKVKLPARDAKPRKSHFSLAERSTRGFPDENAVLRQALTEAQSPLFTHSPPVEPGDELQFSSRGLTDWYVGEFCRINHLKI